jgi:hypothetical protein
MRRLALPMQVSVDGFVDGPNGDSMGCRVSWRKGSDHAAWHEHREPVGDDLPAATRRYTELLGVEPYFTSEAAGRGPGYVEFRIGDYQHELGIMYNRHYRRPGPPLMTNRPASAQRLRDLAWLR